MREQSGSSNFNTLIEKMGNIVKRYVKAYKQDFEQDKRDLQTAILSERKEDKRLVWIVRECGTNLCYRRDVPKNGAYSYYLTELNDNRYYEIDLNKFTCKLIREPQKYYMQCVSEKQMYGTCA